MTGPNTHNDIAVVDKTGAVVAHTRVLATPCQAGVKELLRLLAGLRTSHRHSRKHVPIAIETDRGLLVEALRAAGQPVIPMNPVIVANYRKRMSPARLKSDRGDAALLANIVRVNGTHHHPLPDNTDTADAITELSRTQLQAHHTRQIHYNRLRSVLRDVHPAACHAWHHLPGNLLRPEARAVLALAPTPSTAARLHRRALRNALASTGRTRLVDAHVDRLFTLFREPVLRHRPAVESAWEARVRMCLADLDHACHTLDDITEHLQTAFLAHSHAPIYTSFPGAGILTGARRLGEIGDDLTRFATARGLLAYAGAAPVTWASSTTVNSHRPTPPHREQDPQSHRPPLGLLQPHPLPRLPRPLRPPPSCRRPARRRAPQPLQPPPAESPPLSQHQHDLRRGTRLSPFVRRVMSPSARCQRDRRLTVVVPGH